MSALAWLSAKSYAVLTVVAGFLAMLARQWWLRKDRDMQKAKREQAESALDWQDDVRQLEAQIDAEEEERERQSNKDRADGKVPDHLRNPRHRAP